MTVKLLPLNRKSPYIIDAVRIYNEYIPGELDYQEHFFRTHMRHPGYIGILAQVDDKIVGLTFGSDSLPGQWWHERVASNVGREHPALNNAWVLTQLNILKAYRNRQIGEILLHKVSKAQKRQRLLLSTQVANIAAQRFYLRHGWQVLHQGFRFSSGDEPYKILCKNLQSMDS